MLRGHKYIVGFLSYDQDRTTARVDAYTRPRSILQPTIPTASVRRVQRGVDIVRDMRARVFGEAEQVKAGACLDAAFECIYENVHQVITLEVGSAVYVELLFGLSGRILRSEGRAICRGLQRG